MAEVTLSAQMPSPDDFGPNDLVELVMSQCKTCGEAGTWTRTIRDAKTDRITQYDSWDVKHNETTKHKNYYHFTLTRTNAQIFVL